MRQGKRQQLARQQRRGRRHAGRNSGAFFGLTALREHHQDAARGLVAGVRVAGAQDGRVRIDLDFRPRPVSSAELEEWHEYATSIGIGETRWNSDRTFGVDVVVIPDHDQADDDRLAKLYTRARLRLRESRLQEDGDSLWFELRGPDGWVRVGRKVQMAIDAVHERI